ncbi:MAG: MgtC/SapB family protein [Thermoguttaceae bacterium]
MEPTFERLAVATLLGLLVGLQREHAASGLAGMRTFPLITLLGSLSVLLSNHFGGSWIIAAGLLGIIGIIVVGHRFHTSTDTDPGTTTDVAMLVMYAVGALVMVDSMMGVAMAIGGTVAVLLQFKPELHGIARRLGDKDLRAIMQFVLITCIILPVLPDRNFGPEHILTLHGPAAGQPPGPLDVLNPYWTWMMVVLIVGLSLGGYIIYKFFGQNAGILLGGVLGGAVSSTATTVSYSRDTRDDPIRSRTALVVIMIASTVMYVRVLASVAVVSPYFLRSLTAPVLVLMLLTLVPGLALWYRIRRRSASMPEQKNPTQLRSAIVFGLLYAAVLLALAAARHYWNGQGLLAVAFLSGLTEMDAITLSTARMVSENALPQSEAWRMIVVAAMANLVSKAAIAGLLGGWRLLGRITLLFMIPMLGGAALLMCWR